MSLDNWGCDDGRAAPTIFGNTAPLGDHQSARVLERGEARSSSLGQMSLFFVVLVFAIVVTWDFATASARRIVAEAARLNESTLHRQMVVDAALLECQLVLAQAELYWRREGK